MTDFNWHAVLTFWAFTGLTAPLIAIALAEPLDLDGRRATIAFTTATLCSLASATYLIGAHA